LNAKTVVIVARTLREMERVKAESKDPNKVLILQLDLSKPEECLKKI